MCADENTGKNRKRIMIVDCHTHINCPSSSVDTAQYAESCAQADACIILTCAQQDRGGANKEVGQYIKEKPKTLGFGVFNPVEDKIGLKKVSALTKDLGLQGIVLYCAEERFHPAHSRAMRFYESAQELGLPVFFHNAGPYSPNAVLDYAQPYLLDEVARTFNSLKIVIGSMGVPFVSQTLCMLAKHENVYADLTISPDKVWEVYNIVTGAHEAGVMDKLLFGSGYPFAQPGSCIETLLGFNKLLADTNLPTVPREEIRQLVERDTLTLLGIGSS